MAQSGTWTVPYAPKSDPCGRIRKKWSVGHVAYSTRPSSSCGRCPYGAVLVSALLIGMRRLVPAAPSVGLTDMGLHPAKLAERVRGQAGGLHGIGEGVRRRPRMEDYLCHDEACPFSRR